MDTEQKRLPTILSNQKLWINVFIVVGLGITLLYGMKAVRSYRQLQFIREQGLDRGAASIDAIRPWMTVRYVSVAYAVPAEYIFARIDIPFNRRNINDTLGHLNKTYELGGSGKGDVPAIIDMLAQIILDYRENPVATGLRDVRPWMTLRYIANSTGVPGDELLERLDIGAGDNYIARPLEHLAELTKYKGGAKGLIEAIKTILVSYEEGQL